MAEMGRMVGAPNDDPDAGSVPICVSGSLGVGRGATYSSSKGIEV